MNDPVIAPTYGDVLRNIIPHCEYHVIDSAGHFPHYEQSEVVNPIIGTFLKTTR
jgi:pimeloyl-ACP methyl ester carboxylesterase